ncbi:LacI family DNA-binding transcriptional regulator [Qingshengfaniella alkalisoli]|uniref:Substrate-binding domain-containing protein n=1 Tax=Qingshengfaniella alkalisoli TaxID=2599296 RepID=A0A5B8IBF0_9RHOB|nr:LacI family DNA-binding transcriptional regulator [Qingshengfaniella alkalisoli]QDY71529.1 substrate-binding domain-containing protein [Qingshengfaniella alkalisoli]
MVRPTIKDVAQAAGVSIATVDRVVNNRGGVSMRKHALVARAIAELNYVRDLSAANLSRKRNYRLMFVLPEGDNAFFSTLRNLVRAKEPEAALLRTVLELRLVPGFDSDALVEEIDQIDASRIDGVAIVATESQVVRDAIRRLIQRGVQVLTLVSDLPSSGRHGYVGIDNVAAGRTAARFMGRYLSRTGGKVAVLAGSMIARDHLERRLGFDQIMREDFPHVDVMPSVETLDDRNHVERLVSEALRNEDLAGIYNIGAGNQGLIEAVANVTFEHRPVTIAHDLLQVTRQGVEAGLIDIVIDQAPEREITTAIELLRALSDGQAISEARAAIGIGVYVRDNLPQPGEISAPQPAEPLVRVGET